MFKSWRQLQVIGAAMICLALSSKPISAVGEKDYEAGLNAYQTRDYKVAATAFQKCIQGGNSSPLVWLYLGHSSLGYGDKIHALQAYRHLAENYSKTAEAKVAIQYITKLDSKGAKKYQDASAVARLPSSQSAGLIDRIVIIPPRANHPAVSQQMICTVQEIVRRLPSNIYKILSDGRATLNLGPNIEDKWPGSGDQMKPSEADMTLGEELGRTYGHDVHLYERKKSRGDNSLLEATSQGEISRITYHELGHAVDDITGPSAGIALSGTSSFRSLLQSDLAQISDADKAAYKYFMEPGEACAESIGALMGSPAPSPIVADYTRVRQFLRTKLRL